MKYTSSALRFLALLSLSFVSTQAHDSIVQRDTIISANKIRIRVTLKCCGAFDSLTYSYSIRNAPQAEQAVTLFKLPLNEGLKVLSQRPPVPGWQGTYIYARGKLFVNWANLEDHGDILPGKALSGFSVTLRSLPGIIESYAEGNAPIPVVSYDQDTIHGYDDLTPYGPGVVGTTVGPVLVPDVVDPGSFLDTMVSYTQRSRSLGWISSRAIRDKYLGYLRSAKSSIGQNNVEIARSALQSVLRDVDIDISSAIMSEAYALLRFNAEYLLRNLPARDVCK